MKKLILCTFVTLLFGCASYPDTPEKQATYHINEAKVALAADEAISVGLNTDKALSKYSGDIKVRDFFNSHPKAEEYYYDFLERNIKKIQYPYQAIEMAKKISMLKKELVLKENNIKNLTELFSSVITSGNTSGRIKFTFSDDLNLLPELNSAVHLKIIADRTTDNLIENTNAIRPVRELMDYIRNVGVNSEQGKKIQSQLGKMNIKVDELEYVSKVFPKFAVSRKADVTMKVFLSFKNTNRLVADDLYQSLRKNSKGIDWVHHGNEKDTIVTVELLKNEEKILPEKTETVIYSQYDVNALQAALLMPKNASYLYEVTFGGAEIEYGYAISVIHKGKNIYNNIIRGRVDNKYQRCHNARIQNVFGGVTPANFTANDHMQKKCSSNESVSIDSLRQEVFDKVADTILRVEPIRKIQLIN